MPKTFDYLKFQTTHQGLVSKSDVDPASDETVESLQPAKDVESAQNAGFAGTADERIDKLSRTGVGADELLLRGETPVNSDSAYYDATRREVDPNRIAERQIEESRKAFVAAFTP